MSVQSEISRLTAAKAAIELAIAAKGVEVPAGALLNDMAPLIAAIETGDEPAGGVAEVEALDDKIVIVLADKGPGIPDVELAMQAGYSTAKDHIRNLGFGAGMGLPNMIKYTDDLRIDTVVGEGPTITMTVLL